MDKKLQSTLNRLNANIFYREFSFSKNGFTPVPGKSKELADHVVWIDDLLIIFQLKERENADSSDDAHRSWFHNKVLKKATKQVRDTLQYLRDYPEIHIQNERGHTFNISSASPKRIVKLVVYSGSASLPADLSSTRFHDSRSAGFIHIMTWLDYIEVCTTLITPAELVEYFDFRERAISRWLAAGGGPSESALLGQFLYGDFDSEPNERYVEYLRNLKHDEADFDIFGFLGRLGDHIVYEEFEGDEKYYYKVLAEFAKLNREELREVKKRIEGCVEAVRASRSPRPTRIISTHTGCGFVFIPVPDEYVEQRQEGLRKVTAAAKYEAQIHRQVGISFAKKGDKLRMDILLLDFQWQPNSEMDSILQQNNPFRPLRGESRPKSGHMRLGHSRGSL